LFLFGKIRKQHVTLLALSNVVDENVHPLLTFSISRWHSKHQHSIASSGIRLNSFLDILPTYRTRPQSLCTFQTTADVSAWYEDHVCFSVQTNLQTTTFVIPYTVTKGVCKGVVWG